MSSLPEASKGKTTKNNTTVVESIVRPNLSYAQATSTQTSNNKSAQQIAPQHIEVPAISQQIHANRNTKIPTVAPIKEVLAQSTKYLGLILDKKKTHLETARLTHKRDKFRKALRALYPLIGQNSELNMYNKILLYTAVLRPIITYGSPVWGYAAHANLKILEVTQNSLIRNIVKADRYTRNSAKTLKFSPSKIIFKNWLFHFLIIFQTLTMSKS
ncbi:RNA-directed DNA polymerase from mobile element jockey [Trichonephila clavipes]|uniref:RNA-directed DNA polymerase from mobile element jockey n=1 Tax=Trichonephila clavipes TaxID=2585209 RepID=A0A8X6ST56_TRICX|nr:RNA-directed DNA polymerase from mobile element jockey [Trichonephila clavipes]